MQLKDFIEDLSEKAVLFLIGPPRSSKIFISHYLLKDNIKNNKDVIYISTNKFPEDIMSEIEGFIGDHKIRFIDCYTNFAFFEKENTGLIFRTEGPKALNEIGIALTELSKNSQRPFLFIDTVSMLYLHNNSQELERFIEVEIEKLREIGGTALIMAEEGMHCKSDISFLESIADVTLRFKDKGVVAKGLINGNIIDYEFQEADVFSLKKAL